MVRASVTQCVNEHKYTPQNTLWRCRKYRAKSGEVRIYRVRACRECNKRNCRNYKDNLKKKAA